MRLGEHAQHSGLEGLFALDTAHEGTRGSGRSEVATWATRIAPEGATTSIVGEPRRCLYEQRPVTESRWHRANKCLKDDGGVVGHRDLSRGLEVSRREGEQRLGVGQLTDRGGATRSVPGVLRRRRWWCSRTSRERWASSGLFVAMGRRQPPEAKRTRPPRPPPGGSRAGVARARRQPRGRPDDWSESLDDPTSPALSPWPNDQCNHTLAVPPRRRSTSSMASMRWAWSISSARTPAPPCPNATVRPTARRPPLSTQRCGVQASSTASPRAAGGSISIPSRPFTLAHASQCGRRPACLHPTGEARVAQRVAEPDDLVIEGRGPNVWIVDEARR